MNPYKFVICTPPYANHSAGIVVLHELCDALIEHGYEAYVAFMQMTAGRWVFHSPASDQGFHPNLKRMSFDSGDYDRAVNDALDNGICIYPEIVQGNPLMAKRVVRYFLYHDGGITGVNSSYSNDDYILSFSPAYFKNPNRILFKPVVDSSMHDDGAPAFESRRLDLTFFGKGPKYAQCHLVEGSVELPKAWPKTKSELAVLLRNTRYLYTWDYHSSLNVDAILCGAHPVLMQTKQLELDNLGVNPEDIEIFLSPCAQGRNDAMVHPPNYAVKRERYISRVQGHVNRWVAEVGEAAVDMIAYFR